jgi:hypothetical protein
MEHKLMPAGGIGAGQKLAVVRAGAEDGNFHPRMMTAFALHLALRRGE